MVPRRLPAVCLVFQILLGLVVGFPFHPKSDFQPFARDLNTESPGWSVLVVSWSLSLGGFLLRRQITVLDNSEHPEVPKDRQFSFFGGQGSDSFILNQQQKHGCRFVFPMEIRWASESSCHASHVLGLEWESL